MPRDAPSRFALARLLVVALVVAGACADGRTRLEVRTELPQELRREVETSFEAAHPDIDVRFSEAGARASLEELRSGDGSPFDVWWGAPAVALQRAADRGLLHPYRAAWLDPAARGETADPGPRSAGGDPGGEAWRTILTTPFVIAFDRTAVPIARAPADWLDLFHHRWFGDVRIFDPTRSPEGAYFIGAMLVEALRDDGELVRGLAWLRRLEGQIDAYHASVDEMIRALASGDARVVVLPRADAERARAGDAPWLHYRIPESGTPVLALGVGIAATTERVEAARAFVDHLVEDEVATAMRLHTRWQPAHGTVDDARLPPDFELEQPSRGYPLAVDTLAAELDAWIEGWEREVREWR